MRTTLHDRRPLGLAVGCGAGLLTALLTVVASRSTLPPSPDSGVLLAQLVAGSSFVVVGTLLWWQHRAPRIGLLSIVVALAMAAPHIRWIGTGVTWTLGWALVDVHFIVLAWLILAFPTARLTLRERIFLSIAGAHFAALAIAGLLFQDPWPPCQDCPSNLLLLRVDPSLNNQIWELGQIGNLAIVGAFVALVVNKRNNASSAAQRALSPVTWALTPIALTLVAVFLEPVIGFGTAGARTVLVAERLALSAFPVALLAGMVRTRLDRSRVADLARAVDEVADAGELEALVGQALGDPGAELAFFSPRSGNLIDSTGQPVVERHVGRVAPILWETGDQLGAITHDPAVDPSSVVERRRIERDLHDGAQQGLLALAASLSSIRLQANGAVASRLDAVMCDLQCVIDELRDLARGLHPPVLSERGLVPAIESLAERVPHPGQRRGHRAPVPPGGRSCHLFRGGRDTHQRRPARRCVRDRDCRGRGRRAPDGRRVRRRLRRGRNQFRNRPPGTCRPDESHRRRNTSHQPSRQRNHDRSDGSMRVILAEDSVLFRRGLARLLGDARPNPRAPLTEAARDRNSE